MIVLVHQSEMHSGSKFGLLAPDVVLVYDSGRADKAPEKKPIPQESWSQWVWDDVFLPGIAAAIEYAGDAPIVVADTGDEVHGGRFVKELYDNDADHQADIAFRSMEEWRKAPTYAGAVLTFGTDEHDFGHGSGTRLLAGKMAAWGLPVSFHDHHKIPLGGLLVDIAHHGPGTGDGEHHGGVSRRYCQRRVREALERNEQAPGIILRGHVHRDFCETVFTRWGANGRYETLMSIAPPLCGPNAYAINRSQSVDRIRSGMTFIAIDDGKVIDWKCFLVERDTRKYFVFPGLDGVDAHPYRGTPRKGSAADKMRAWWQRRKAGSAV